MDAVLLDNGAWRVKAGLGGDASQLEPGLTAPNCCGKLKGHLGALAADEIDEVVRTQQLYFQRPADRGYVTDWGLEFDVWARVLGAPGLNASNLEQRTLYLTEAPLAPAPLQEYGLEMVFEEFCFGG
eukprot:CAMPEP_0118878742 /NCGR_PEP_ID=MMETSP1163-20130328/18646_1 /TAXON_ID=124430 /ORGANISM="Phaeomonas parva, Strain CCMP2877" /LENGTH=126 /DNA_ID=CAMNT_0006814673 /DNA_START=21 /DNA_END=397 /DNA_ORIENTATION=+